MPPLPDDALVVRGGLNLPENFTQGSGVTISSDGRLQGVSVNSGAGKTVEELTAPNRETGYPGIPNNRVGITTAGKIRAMGGDVHPDEGTNKRNPNHAIMSGLTAEQASKLFNPTVKNPSRQK